MKKTRKLFKFLLLGLTSISLGACFGGNVGGNTKNDTNTTQDTKIDPTGVTLDKTEMTVEVGETFKLVASVAPDNASDLSVTWSSSATTVAVVDQDGNVTTIKKGNATIKAKTSNGKTASCKLEVVKTPVINNKKFVKDNLYVFAGQFIFEGVTNTYDLRYTFKNDGTATLKDEVNKTEKNYTYEVYDGMIYVYKEDKSLESMYFYYDNVIMSASILPVTLARDGSGVSQEGTSTLGYYAIIQANVGDSLGVLTGDDNSAGYYVPLRENGTLNDRNVKNIKSDQITAADFDTTSPCTKIIKINIGGKSYNCLFIVSAI